MTRFGHGGAPIGHEGLRPPLGGTISSTPNIPRFGADQFDESAWHDWCFNGPSGASSDDDQNL